MDKVLARLERAGMSQCAPKLNKEQTGSRGVGGEGLGAVAEACEREAEGRDGGL